MLKKFCKWYIKEEIEKEVNKRVNTLLDIKKENFEIGDIVYFYYRFNKPYPAYGRYYKAKIHTIETVELVDKSIDSKYYVDVLDGNFSKYEFFLSSPNISKTKVGLRNKILNSEVFGFDSNTSYTKINLEDE